MRTAQRVMLGLVSATLCFGVLVPIYTDEVAWRMQLSRFVEDGWVDHANGLSCGANTIAVPPLMMWPIRLFSSGVTWLTVDPLYVRLGGIAVAMVIVLLFRVLIDTLAHRRESSDRLKLFAYAMLGMGTLPFLLVWSRPEQPMLLAILLTVLITLRPAPATMPGFVARLAGIVMLAVVALSYHLKAVVYLPLFLVAAAVLPRPLMMRSIMCWRIVAAGGVTATGIIAGRYWAHRFACPADPVLAARLAQENMLTHLLAGGWSGLPSVLPRLLLGVQPLTYILNGSPVPRVMSNWLPQLAVGLVPLLPWIIPCVLAWFAVIAFGAISIARVFADRVRFTSAQWLGLALVICSSGWAALQLHKNTYETTLYLPVLLLSVLLLWSPAAVPDRRRGVLMIAGVSAASQCLLVGVYAPMLWPTTGGGYIADQSVSISGFRFARSQIVAAGAKCGLAPRPGLSRVMVDDLTYFAYARTMWPLDRLAVFSDWDEKVRDPYGRLRHYGSPGGVLACAYLPPDLRRRAIVSGPLCCVDTR